VLGRPRPGPGMAGRLRGRLTGTRPCHRPQPATLGYRDQLAEVEAVALIAGSGPAW